MAEQEIVWNKPLLLVAVLLGVLAAVLFFAYDRTMQNKISGDLVNMLQWKAAFPAGHRVSPKDVETVALQRERAEQMSKKGYLTEKDMVLLSGKNVVLSRNVDRTEYVMFTDVIGGSSEGRGLNPREGMRALPLRVDPNNAPGGLRVHDRVDMLGLLEVPGKGSRSYTILKNVRVLGVGSRTEEDENVGSGASNRAAMRSYRNVTVEVTPKTAQQLVAVMDRIRGGKVWIAIRPLVDEPAGSTPSTPAPGDGELEPEVADLLSKGMLAGSDE